MLSQVYLLLGDGGTREREQGPVREGDSRESERWRDKEREGGRERERKRLSGASVEQLDSAHRSSAARAASPAYGSGFGLGISSMFYDTHIKRCGVTDACVRAVRVCVCCYVGLEP